MQIQVLFFAVFRERIGREHQALELAAGADVEAAIAALAAEHETVRALVGRFQVAVNQTVVAGDTILVDGDELALIPPVAGGADDNGQARHVTVSEQPLTLERCVAAVGGEAMGGIVTFTGVVRRQSRGQRVDHIVYEAYAAMAEKVIVELCVEIEAEIPDCKLAVEHAVGKLEVGDLAVAIAAAAPHRAEAFAACRAMIDRLKERVPIWKKETGTDGSEWIGLGP
jgi:molybdopterin converting factor subunit 1